jgi:hypothetical protein
LKLPLNIFLGDKTMEIIIALLVLAGLGAIWYFNRDKGFDANKDGKVDFADAKPLVEETVKQVADVNKDGQVNVADAKVVAEKVRAVAKKATPKAKPAAKTAVKKARTPKMKVVK